MKLSNELVDELRVLNMLIEHHRKIAETLKQGMVDKIKDALGIDATQSDYRLDLEKGTLYAVTE